MPVGFSLATRGLTSLVKEATKIYPELRWHEYVNIVHILAQLYKHIFCWVHVVYPRVYHIVHIGSLQVCCKC